MWFRRTENASQVRVLDELIAIVTLTYEDFCGHGCNSRVLRLGGVERDLCISTARKKKLFLVFGSRSFCLLTENLTYPRRVNIELCSSFYKRKLRQSMTKMLTARISERWWHLSAKWRTTATITNFVRRNRLN